MNLETIISTLQQYFKTLPIQKAWIFGSYARGEQTSASDIDILVAFSKGYIPGVFGYSDIILHIEDLLGIKVDLVEENRLLPYIAKEVENEKIIIYERAS